VNQIRIMVVDDHPIVLRALADLLSTEPDLELAATCTSGEEALERFAEVAPDVIVLDFKLAQLDGVAVLRQLNENGFAGQVVFLTAQMDDGDALEAIRLGARGIVFKDQAPEELVTALRRVLSGERWLPARLMDRALDAALRRDPAEKALTARELDVCRLIALGHSNKRIARELNITEGTVKIHLNNIFRKLGASSRLQVALEARNRGLLKS
jgi:DNA-binding NarL/FixJ family response regulator